MFRAVTNVNTVPAQLVNQTLIVYNTEQINGLVSI